MKFQIIIPAAKKGKNSFTGALKRVLNNTPMQATMTPVEIVIQKGPRVDRLYLCLISTRAKYKGKPTLFKPLAISAIPIFLLKNSLVNLSPYLTKEKRDKYFL